VTLFGQVNGHGETHVTKSNKADFGKGKDIFDDKIHLIYANIR
jgi:hypothetical protein